MCVFLRERIINIARTYLSNLVYNRLISQLKLSSTGKSFLL